MSYSPSDFQVGDIVRVRQWDDMKEEFGGDVGDYEINMPHLFVKGMRRCCGKEFRLLRIDHPFLCEKNGHSCEAATVRLDGVVGGFTWNTLMIEPVHTKTLFNMDDFTTMLGG